VKSHRNTHQILTTTLWFLVHLLIGSIGVLVASGLVAYSIVLPLHSFLPSVGEGTAHWILTETPYFPLQILVGLLLGFQLGRRYGHSVMLWTWTVPALTIALLILFAPLRPVVVSGVEITGTRRFFGWNCLPQNHCFEQVGATLPFYSCLAYSVGAFFARMISPSSPSERKDVPPNGAAISGLRDD